MGHGCADIARSGIVRLRRTTDDETAEALRLIKKLVFEELGAHRLWLDVTRLALAEPIIHVC